ncbi:hypothetical protein G6F68_016192 [Rhizopus microsporus]|nr:hypothetical protein G6F68_016192 [Rhizopus microsporus]
MDAMYTPVGVNWRLNERHYGALQGLNKAETAAQYGDEQVLIWRRAYAIAPEPLSLDDKRHPLPERHRGTRAAVLERFHRPGHPRRPQGAGRRPRQQLARPDQAPGQCVR